MVNNDIKVMTTVVIIEAWITLPAIKKHKHKLVRKNHRSKQLFLIIPDYHKFDIKEKWVAY